MGSDNAGVDRLTGTGAGDAPRWDRFARWGRWPARALLALADLAGAVRQPRLARSPTRVSQ